LSLNKSFDIGTVICPRAVVLALGLRSRANTTSLGQITVPISNLLFNNIYNQRSNWQSNRVFNIQSSVFPFLCTLKSREATILIEKRSTCSPHNSRGLSAETAEGPNWSSYLRLDLCNGLWRIHICIYYQNINKKFSLKCDNAFTFQP